MANDVFRTRLQQLNEQFSTLSTRPNRIDWSWDNGLFDRYVNPVLTAAHVPLNWRYDLSPATNPYLIERLAVNAVFNPGAIELNGKILLVARVEGADRKSFFAVAESTNGIDNFRFWSHPLVMPETDNPDANVYDMRVVRHEDGWIYGVFCTERKDPSARPGDLSSAVAQAGIARTKDMESWERLADLKTPSAQQRNVVLHPEFVDGRYAFYTRPQDDFIDAGSGGGIGWGLSPTIENAEIASEEIIEPRRYHTITELKNGQGPAPIKTEQGWLHFAHGVRNTAAGLRYVLFAFLSELGAPNKVTHRPGGYLIAPVGPERIGDVSNVAFCNGVVARGSNLFIYYASSDSRVHVATTTIAKMLEYVTNTPEDPLRSAACVEQRFALIAKNLAL